MLLFCIDPVSVNFSGLAQDGCRMNASSVLYTSVKSARECVAALHQKVIQGKSVWARQLGGEVDIHFGS